MRIVLLRGLYWQVTINLGHRYYVVDEDNFVHYPIGFMYTEETINTGKAFSLVLPYIHLYLTWIRR